MTKMFLQVYGFMHKNSDLGQISQRRRLSWQGCQRLVSAQKKFIFVHRHRRPDDADNDELASRHSMMEASCHSLVYLDTPFVTRYDPEKRSKFQPTLRLICVFFIIRYTDKVYRKVGARRTRLIGSLRRNTVNVHGKGKCVCVFFPFFSS